MCPWAPGPAGSADFLDIWRKRLTRPRPGQLPFRSPREWAGAGPEGKGTLRKVGAGRRFSAERARSNLGDGQRARRKRQASEQSPVSAEETEAASSSSALVQKSLKSAEEESGGCCTEPPRTRAPFQPPTTPRLGRRGPHLCRAGAVQGDSSDRAPGRTVGSRETCVSLGVTAVWLPAQLTRPEEPGTLWAARSGAQLGSFGGSVALFG